jgi:uracil-DNA glycosylase
MEKSEKVDRLLELAKQRQNDRMEGYFNLADFHEGYYECDYVVPWTISACNVDADLMLISQDWASADFLNGEKNPEQKRIGQVEHLETNKNVKHLLKEYMGISFGETYATDAFVFIKPGPMNAPLPFRDLLHSTRKYTLPQIDIVSPKMVICLGSAPFNAIRRAVGINRMSLSGAFQVTSPLHTSYNGVPIFGVAHPGGTGIRAVGGKKVAFERWKDLGEYFHSIRSRP